MAVDRCVCCLGRKTLIGLGNILVKCYYCKGVGYVDSVKVANEPAPESIPKPIPRSRAKPATKAVAAKKPYVLKDI